MRQERLRQEQQEALERQIRDDRETLYIHELFLQAFYEALPERKRMRQKYLDEQAELQRKREEERLARIAKRLQKTPVK